MLDEVPLKYHKDLFGGKFKTIQITPLKDAIFGWMFNEIKKLRIENQEMKKEISNIK